MPSRKNEYGNSSIKVLKGADRVRKRPGVIFGSDGIEGCKHSVFEILSNSIDEAREGHGDKIIVTKFLDGSVEIEDFGRGVPVDYNKHEEKFNWELVYCELYAGGKYRTNEGESYEYSLGLNGLGACATQYTSEYMDVCVYRDGFKYTLHFEKGENIGGLSKEATRRRKTGTTQKWKPDRDVFTEINMDNEFFEDMLKRQAVVNSGVQFVFRFQTQSGFEEKEFIYQNGVSDYVSELVGDNSITNIQNIACERRGKDREDKPEYKVKMQFAFCFSNHHNITEYYHNGSFLEHGGSPEKAVKSAFVWGIDSYLKQNNKYLKGESKINFADVEDCLLLISSSFSTMTSYENQTKKAITNKFIYESMTDFLKHQLEIYFLENPDEAIKIAEQVLVNKRARENAEKTRLNIKKKLSGNLDISNRVQKFVDCRSRDRAVRELFIVEGDSALGACKLSRNADFQAIIPVRGKILNCLKADYSKIFKSDIITDIVKVLGCGIEVKTKGKSQLSSFDLDALRFNKVIICTDADVDGFQIRTLILTMIYKLMPSLIKEGFVYIAESPLYEISTKDDVYFAYSEKEKAKVLSQIGEKKYTIQRSKGLGENEPDMMWLTTMNPETRRLVKVELDNFESSKNVFDLLLGDNLQGRKEYISENGHLYVDKLDIS